MDDSLDAWFVREVLVHEQALTRFLHRHWRKSDEVPDLRQEIYARIYKAAIRQRPRSPKSFLFTSARNLLADLIRRQHVVSILAVGDIEDLNVLKEERTPERWLDGHNALRRLAAAIDCLPDRCREVVWLCRVEQLTHKKVAQQLGISEKTVEKHIAKGARLMAECFHAGAREEKADSGADWQGDRGQSL